MILEYVYKTNIFFKLVTETGSRVTIWGRRGRDHMVVGFTTTYAISTYHH